MWSCQEFKKNGCAVVGKRLNSQDCVIVASEGITTEGDVLKIVSVVLMAVRKHNRALHGDQFVNGGSVNESQIIEPERNLPLDI